MQNNYISITGFCYNTEKVIVPYTITTISHGNVHEWVGNGTFLQDYRAYETDNYRGVAILFEGAMCYDYRYKKLTTFISNKWYDSNNNCLASVKIKGLFSEKPAASDIYIGFRYFCTDKQTSEGATNGIEIIHKGNDVWVDALGREIS